MPNLGYLIMEFYLYIKKEFGQKSITKSKDVFKTNVIPFGLSFETFFLLSIIKHVKAEVCVNQILYFKVY
jgi:hypothetical protein